LDRRLVDLQPANPQAVDPFLDSCAKCSKGRSMNYKSMAELAQDILAGLPRLPLDLDLVVGIPRSGMLAAYQIALLRNLQVCSLGEYAANAPFGHGRTRSLPGQAMRVPAEARHVLVVDDSIASGESMKAAQRLISSLGYGHRVSYAAIYAIPASAGLVDIAFQMLSMPRVFQWNLFHRNDLRNVYFDIDGILCLDPTAEENDDGPRYMTFLENARPAYLPSRPVGGFITCRLEKYRGPTEEWLHLHQVQYQSLYMLDLPSAEARRVQQAYGAFKASVYRTLLEAWSTSTTFHLQRQLPSTTR